MKYFLRLNNYKLVIKMEKINDNLANRIVEDLLESNKKNNKDILNQHKKNVKVFFGFSFIGVFLITLAGFVLSFMMRFHSEDLTKYIENMNFFLSFLNYSLPSFILILTFLAFNFRKPFKKAFSMENKIKSLKKNLLLTIDNNEISQEEKEEALSLLKEIKNERLITKLIKSSPLLRLDNICSELKKNNFNHFEKVGVDKIESKSILLENNINELRKELI